MPSFFEKLYSISPVIFQTIGINLFGLTWKYRRFGGRFSQLLFEFKSRERFSHDQWNEYQNIELQKLLKTAWKVKYYCEIFHSNGMTQEDISKFSLDNLLRLPILEKQSMRKNPFLLLPNDAKKTSLHSFSTSGTTGTPLTIFMSDDTHRAISAAYEARCRNWAGVNYKMRRAMIGGRMVVPKAMSRPPFWRVNYSENQLYLSAFHISPANTSLYVQAINKFKPDYLVGYSVSHFLLASMIREQGLRVHQPKAILTSSEKLTSEMRTMLEVTYGCEVFDGYSGVENCCLASECKNHNLHISPDVGIVEIVDDNGEPVGFDKPGQIIATGLLNFDQPLIRYRTGDIGILSSERCSCGNQMPILNEIVGRLEDIVISSDGRQMVRFHGVFVGIPHIIEGQVIQEKIDEFVLKLVTDSKFCEEDKQLLRQRMFDRLGKVKLEICLVDQIEKTENGKYRAVISKVKI